MSYIFRFNYSLNSRSSYQRIIKINKIIMDIEQLSTQLLSSRNRKQQLLIKKQQPINYQSVIKQLNQTINKSFTKLQTSYTQTSTKNQSYLLNSYIKILDKVLDELLYAKEKVSMVELQDIKDQKCVNYLEHINQYRGQCYRVKSQIETKKQVLKEQKKITQKMEWDKNNMEILCDKKEKEISICKGIIKLKQQKLSKCRSKISTIMEDNQKQSDNLQKSEKQLQQTHKSNSIKVNNLKLLISKRKIGTASNTMRVRIKPKIQNLSQKIQNKSFTQTHSLTQKPQKKQKSLIKLQNSSLVTKQIELCPQLNDNFKVMPSPLWLYQPSSRKSKLLNKNLIDNVVPKLKANFNIKQDSHSNKESACTSQESSRRDNESQKNKRNSLFNSN